MAKRIINSWLTQKKAILAIAVLVSAVLLLYPQAAAKAYGYDWDITSFHSDITVREDASLLVKETITADFTREAHHGIFRTIPVKYEDQYSQNYNLRLNVLSVTDENGNEWWTDISKEGDYVRIQSGDPDRYINEPMTFIITYDVRRAVKFSFDDHDELYWNATGDEWEVPILKSTARIIYPESISAEDVRANCFTGSYGSAEQSCGHAIEGNNILYKADRELGAYEGLTIVAALPKNVLVQPSGIQEFQWFIIDNWGYLLPVPTFLIMYFLWYTRGRDAHTRYNTVMPIYKPIKGLGPGEIGTLIDEKADMRDISAVIIDLAIRGYLKIHEKTEKGLLGTDRKYTFERLDDPKKDPGLKKHEEKILSAVFNGKKKRELDDLKNQFYTHVPKIKKALYDRLIGKKYFRKSPDKVREGYQAMGWLMFMGPIFILGAIIPFGLVAPAVGIVLSGLIIILFAKAMPAKTAEGSEAYYKVLGLEEYIKTAEKDRIKFQEDNDIFMELLPYAMALDLAEKWTNTFKDLYKKVPDWMDSDDPDFINRFNTRTLYYTLNSFQNSASTAMLAAPRSSGSGGSWSGGSGFSGGFSGGGFGGGGGGSW